MVEVRTNRVGEQIQVSTQARTHAILADATVPEGGTDQGPTPHELLAASLSACTSITVQMYANRKGWPLKSADVTVRLVKGEGTDANTATTFDLTVSLSGDLSSDQRERLLEIANRCPVHRILANPIELRVVLV